MRLNIITAVIVSAVMLAGGAPAAFAAECVVADPIGTPLNVRSEPQGAVLSTLRNGTAVEVVERQALGGKRWARIAIRGETVGWVFSTYLDCAIAGDRGKSAPMHPRTPPQ
jgi:uncharacterized protein YraI